MKKLGLSFIILLLLSQNVLAMNSRNLTILAEPNMVLALTKIARIYSQQSNVITSLYFASSVDLIDEVDSGEPADIFISAHLGSIETLRQKGLVDVYNIGYIARDEMILVGSKSNSTLPAVLLDKNITFEGALEILNQNKSALVIDSIGSSSGKFSSDFVNSLGVHKLNLISRLNEDKTPILEIVKSDPQNYAILLQSQVAKDNDLQILAAKKDSNIFYQSLVIAGDNMEVAREFLKFLKGGKAREILAANGFIVD